MNDSPATTAAMPAPLAELAHELRTPLTAILGFADAMAGRSFGPLSDRYVDAAQAIGAAGRHMLDLIDALADISRLQSGRPALAPEPADARALIENLLPMFAATAAAARIDLTLAPGADPRWVRADPRALRQIVINLVANALAATPPGGEIVVSISRDGASAVIAVRDSGPGLAPASLREGALGLRLVAAYCEAQGGAFSLSNPPGGGALALARLPILDGT